MEKVIGTAGCSSALDRAVVRGGIAIDADPQLYPNGRFARLHDPEGNPIDVRLSRAALRPMNCGIHLIMR
jgi:predicted enzyme related to lactoylglutathione lyase